MSKFDWETEEDNQNFPQVNISSSSIRPYRLYIVISSLIVLLLVTIAISVRLLQESKQQSRQVETDIYAAYQLWREAVNNSDLDLLNTILLGGDTGWMTEQRHLFKSDRIVDRSAFGLQAETGEMIPDSSGYQLAGDWRSVDFSFLKIYWPEELSRSDQPIELIHTVGFHREGSRWLLGQQNDQFWGEWISIELDNVIATYPVRDRNTVRRVVGDLDRELSEACWQIMNAPCSQEEKLTINFKDDPALLLKTADATRPTFQEGQFALITPTLLGLPTDEESYQAIYKAYTEAILYAFKSELKSPRPFPGQQLYLLCTPELGSRQGLYRYDFETDRLLNFFSGQSFGSFSPLEKDAGLLLFKYPHPEDGSRLRMIVWSPFEKDQLIDYGSLAFQPFPATEIPLASQPSVLLRTANNNPDDVRFRLINGSLCFEGSCESAELDGFPTWSPDGEHTMLWQSGTIYLGSETGESVQELGEGFTPFWLGNDLFGLAQFTSGGVQPEVVLYYGHLPDKELRTLISSSEAAEMADLSLGGRFYIQYALTHPKKPNDLILIGREYAGTDSHYHLLRLELSISEPVVTVTDVEHLLTIKGTPANFPSSAAPMGQLPVVSSPDGNYLAIGRKGDSDTHYWEIQVVDLEDRDISIFETMYPADTFLHPYFDWSLDSQWLAVVDAGFLQLISPENDYRRFIAHDMYTCNQIAWVNN